MSYSNTMKHFKKLVFFPKKKIEFIVSKLDLWKIEAPEKRLFGNWWGDTHMLSLEDDTYRIWGNCEEFSFDAEYSNMVGFVVILDVTIQRGTREQIESILKIRF